MDTMDSVKAEIFPLLRKGIDPGTGGGEAAVRLEDSTVRKSGVRMTGRGGVGKLWHGKEHRL